MILASYLGILVSTGRGGSFPKGLSKRERAMKEDEKRIFDVKRRGRGRDMTWGEEEEEEEEGGEEEEEEGEEKEKEEEEIWREVR